MVAVYPRMEVLMARRRSANQDIGPLARILRRLRGEMDLLQRQVVARAGWDVGQQPYYSSLETGAIQNPGDEKLGALDKAFELEPGSLAHWLEHGPPWAVKPPDTGAHIDIEFLPMGVGDEIRVLMQRIPADRRQQATEIIRQQAVTVLRIFADDDARAS